MGRPTNTLENDKSGLTFGRLKVIHPIFRQTGRVKRVYYKCICNCGKEVYKRSDALVRNKNNTYSCGCWQREIACELKTLGQSEGFLKRAWSGYKKNSKTKLIPFKLTLQQFKEIVVLNCYYCGSPPSRKDTLVESNTLLINGIDRVIPHIGYVEGNMVPCCFPCNQRKSNDSVEEFKLWIQRVYNHLKLGGN